MSRITVGQIGQVIKPLLEHLDRNKFWPTDNSVSWTQIFMKSVRESYSQMIVKQVLGKNDHARWIITLKITEFH